jgi:hypothetical protein
MKRPLIDLSLSRDDRGFQRLASVVAVVDHPSWFAPQRIRLYQIVG